MLGALARGTSRVRGLLDSADVRSTAAMLRALGARVDAEPDGRVRIDGGGPESLRAASEALDAGNSGTTARLMTGVLGALPFESRMIGDASLSQRPMGRVAAPLRAMCATVELAERERLPMRIVGGALQPVDWTSPVASAQVKSAVLLAACAAGIPSSVTEPAPSRDHTERMLRARGVAVESSGATTAVQASRGLRPLDCAVPGDPSSAAFFAVLAALAASGEVELPNVGANPGRTGAFRVLDRMGARIGWEDLRDEGGEPVATLVVAPRTLKATEIAPDEVPSLIDELPALACLAARTPGETRVTGAAELRVKESDRIALIVSNLRAVGADAEELPDGFVVRGSDRPLAGRVLTGGDHRIAMAFGVLGAATGGLIEVDDSGCVAVSYPAFWNDLTNACG